jgi:hypothetical protein
MRRHRPLSSLQHANRARQRGPARSHGL